MNEETIFVQTDPAFNVVLQSLRELGNQRRLEVTHFQTASLESIESSNEAGKFGGQHKNRANAAFGQTAYAVVRMCMLEAVGVPRSEWPKLSGNTDSRNRAKLQHQVIRGPLFNLAIVRDVAEHYWSKYDHIYPHFWIENKVRQVAINRQVSMPSMMLIFRRNFTEVVEITTTFTATPRGDQRFDSHIFVICMVRKITAESSVERPDGECTKVLKKLMKPVHISDAYYTKMKELKEGDDLNGVLDVLPKLSLNDETE